MQLEIEMVKFTKGQQVWQFFNWNDSTVGYRLVTVESWGKARGTVSLVSDGKMSKSRVYTDCVNLTNRMADYGGEHYFAATEGFDPRAKALELATALIACKLEREQQKLLNPCYHHESVRANIAALQVATPAAHAR